MLKQDHLGQIAQHCMLSVEKDFYGLRGYSLSGQSIAMLNRLHIKRETPHVQEECLIVFCLCFCVFFFPVPIVSCPPSETTGKSLVSPLQPSFRYWDILTQSPESLLFPSLKCCIFHSFSCYERCSNPFIVYVALCWSFSGSSTSPM